MQPRNDSVWTTIPRSRLTPPGAVGATPVVWFARAAFALLAIALVAFLVSLVKPLARPAADAGPTLPAIPPPPPPVDHIAHRQALLAQLNEDNPFSPGRTPWSLDDPTNPSTDPGDADPAQLAQDERDRIQAKIDEIMLGSGAISVTNRDDLPPDLQAAFDNLELKGIRSRADGQLVAMITLRHSPDRPKSTAYARGDTFVDDQNSDESWQIRWIDRARDRVIVSRRGENMALQLFGSIVADTTPVEADAAGAEPTADALTREQIIAELVTAGASPEDIAEFLKIYDEVKAELAADQIAEAPEPETLESQQEELENAAGFESIIKLMSTTEENNPRFRKRQPPPEDPPLN